MHLTDLILNSQNQASILVHVDVELYVHNKTIAEIREEFPPQSPTIRKIVGPIIRKQNLEFLLFKAVAGYEAQEEIRVGSKKELGYSSYILARLLSGRKMPPERIRRYFLDLSRNNDMQVLTEASRSYIENFDVKYIRNTPADELRLRIPIFAKPVKKPEDYTLFLKELHKKVKEDKVLQYEVLKKWMGIESEDQISYAGTKDIPGYSCLKSLCAFFTRRIMTDKETGRYLKWLMRTKGGRIKTESLTDIIMGFEKGVKPTYVARVVREYTSSMTPEEVRRDLPLHLPKERDELSRKIRKLKLQYIVFKACTGYEFIEDIKQNGTADKKGYSSFTALAYLLSGSKKGVVRTGKYFRYLAKKNGMPLLSPRRKLYLDNFTKEYVKRTSSRKLQEEIPVVQIILNPNAVNYMPFLAELSKKASNDREFQYEFLRKWVGARTKEEFVGTLKGGILGSCSFKSMASFLSGKIMTKPQSRKYLRDLVEKYAYR